MMVGRPVKLDDRQGRRASRARTILEVDGPRGSSTTPARSPSTASASRSAAGEIYALAGVQGNGQTELTEALVGLEPRRVRHGHASTASDVTRAGIDDILGLGVGYVPEDRLHDGLVSSFSVAENLVLDLYDREPFSNGISLDLDRDPAERRASGSRSSTSAPRRSSTRRRTLSGGNQQKVVLARELSRPLKLLIVAQPTRGLDVGSMEFVHRRIVAERDNGAAVIVVSTELDEVLGARRPDRRHVPRQDHRRDARRAPTPSEIGLLMAGTVPEPTDKEVSAP